MALTSIPLPYGLRDIKLRGFTDAWATCDITFSMPSVNTGTGSQFVTKVHLDSITADAGHASCDVSSSGANAAFAMADVTVGETIAAGATVSKSGSLAMNDTGVNQDSCQGATLTLTFSSN